MSEYLGGLFAAKPAVRQPFELGFAAMGACRWDQAIGHFQKAVAETKGVRRVALLNLIGVCHYTQGRPDVALKDFEESARLAEKFGDKRGKARALGNTGLIYRDNGELDRALSYLEGALAIAREARDRWAVAIHLGYTGNIHHDKGELDRALEYYGEALAITREIGDQWGVASNLSNIGSIYRDKGRLDEALECDNGALAVARELGHLLGVATDLGNIGLILKDQSKHEQAVPKLAEALIALLNMGVADGPRQTLTGLAGCEDKLGRRRLVELLEDAGRDDGVIAELLERVDQMRQKRPE